MTTYTNAPHSAEQWLREMRRMETEGVAVVEGPPSTAQATNEIVPPMALSMFVLPAEDAP